MRKTSLRRGYLVMGWLVCLLQSSVAMAQLAPVVGSHYGARASDTGFAGAVNSQGGYGASVPLDLPAARGGLPLPIQIVYGGNQVGAAGMGWDVPLSFISRSTTTAHRRPAPQASFSVTNPIPLLAPERWVLSLGGERTDLVRNAANAAWVARRGNAQIEVRTDGAGAMVMYDGNGLTYSFSAQGQTVGSALDNGNLYLLRNITGPGGTRVHLEYGISAPALPGGGTGLSINLASVSYNKHPTESCSKHKIQLNYDSPAAGAAPLAMMMLNSVVLTRVQKLTSVDVISKPSCAESERSLRKYTLAYQADVDTQRPQLQKVTMIGQQGTPERSVTLPVAAYSYGSIVDSTNNLITYQKTQNSGPRMIIGAHHYSFGLGYTSAVASAEPHGPRDALVDLYTAQGLVDLNGDGRPDFFGEAGLYRNMPGPNGTTDLKTSILDTGGAPLSSFRGKIHATLIGVGAGNPYGGTRAQPITVNDTMQQLVDLNADGRMDVLEVSDDNDYWVLHLNTPDSVDPSKIKFVNMRIRTGNIRSALNTTGLAFGRVPLSRASTVPAVGFVHCWVWDGAVWNEVSKINCPELPFYDHTKKKTLTEWELRDVNGDGYPDLIYNASFVRSVETVDTFSRPITPGTFQWESRGVISAADMVGTRDIRVLINTAGVHLVDQVELFASPKTLEVGGVSGCGVGRWQPDAIGDTYDVDGILNETCGFEDINGDGITDRVTSVLQDGQWVTRAALGTGNPEGFFSTSAMVLLPGPLARAETPLHWADGNLVPQNCVPPAQQTFDSRKTRGLRDINGDHIPDYVSGDVRPGTGNAFGNWNVAMGTGTGFAPSVPVDSPVGLELSLERSACFGGMTDYEDHSGAVGATPKGLYDLDGDGQPEVVQMGEPGTWEVYQLKPTAPQIDVGSVVGVPASGRLVKIENGYGAVTRVGYRSAKEDMPNQFNVHHRHNLPYSEIVVAAVATTDVGGNLLTETTRHAYGNAELMFDSALDAFVFPGYQRAVTVVTTDAATSNRVATITDRYGLAGFTAGMDAAARFKRYRMVGLVSDVTTIAGFNIDVDPWNLLNTNVAFNNYRIAGSHYNWDVRLLSAGPAPVGNEKCVDMMFPYSFVTSGQLQLSDDQCTAHGFIFQKDMFSWRGTPGSSDPIGSDQTAKIISEVKSVDDFGRITSAIDDGDLMRGEDDLCTQTVYAVPTGTNERVLNALASRVTTNCGAPALTLAQESWEYDTSATGLKLPVGKVSDGFVTAHIVSRRDVETGATIPNALGSSDIRLFDATYDSNGNPISITKVRDDGASQTNKVSFDPFGLMPVAAISTAINADGTALPSMTTAIAVDPVTLNVLSSTDANGAKSGATFDGFGRVLLSTVTPVGATEGVLSSMAYNGFAAGQIGGRNIVQKVFTDPVPTANIAAAVGRIGTSFLDALGRIERREMLLGADYSGKKLVVGQRVYDMLGRVSFEADPFLSTDNFSTAYGTTHVFAHDGTLSCVIRGPGLQTSCSTNEASERYATLYSRFFEIHKEFRETRDAASLLPNTGQSGVVHESAYSAIGRLLERSTFKLGIANFEKARFHYDALGRLDGMTRYQDPQMMSKAVTTTWHYDSLGWLTKLVEPESAPQFRTYDNWGELTQTQWNDTTTYAWATDRRIIMKYDALGRTIHSEEQSKKHSDPDISYLTDATTLNDYVYDQPNNNPSPPVTATNVLGRLSQAISPTSKVSFSYDGLGRINAQVFADTSFGPTRNTYVEKHATHGDGSPQTLQLLLPDTGFKVEKIDYSYDSAGRTRSVKYNDGSNQDLFTTAGSTDLDVLGRIRQAQYGLSTYTASYAESGRRLPTSVKVTGGAHSREIAYPAITSSGGASRAPFDPLGRERGRTELVDGVVSTALEFEYDPIGQLVSSTRAPLWYLQNSYDALGNLLTQVPDSGTSGVTLTYQTSGDLDRLCSVRYGTGAVPAGCNVKYDGVGNIVSMPARSGTRAFSYYASGLVKTIVNGSDLANFRYDAFGAVQQLTVYTNSPDVRHDMHFGGLLTQRDEGGASVLTRRIPVPGLVATRHGPNGTWTFAFGENRGTRFVTDQTGAFVQDIDYRAYGETPAVCTPPALCPTPGTKNYTSEQWNGGDALVAFGLSQLGARIYDPVIGRFLSRDPLLIPRTAATSNPYAFAKNDPINHSDPSGLESPPGPGDPPPPCGTGNCDSDGNGESLGDIGDSLGHFFYCIFGDCGAKKPPPKTSTTSTSGGKSHGPYLGPWGVSLASDAYGGGPESVGPYLGPWPVSVAGDPEPEDRSVPNHDFNQDNDAVRNIAEVVADAGDPLDFAEWAAEQGAERSKKIVDGFLGEGEHYFSGGVPTRAGALLGRATKVAGRLGNVADAVEIGTSVVDFSQEPTVGNGYVVARTVVGTILMSQGPQGWFFKFVAIPATEYAVEKYVAPATEQAGRNVARGVYGIYAPF